MAERNNIQIDLVKLATGERLLRLSEARSGFSLEKKLDPKQPVARQKKSLLNAFVAALAQADLNAA
jgi:hypothetical protein